MISEINANQILFCRIKIKSIQLYTATTFTCNLICSMCNIKQQMSTKRIVFRSFFPLIFFCFNFVPFNLSRILFCMYMMCYTIIRYSPIIASSSHHTRFLFLLFMCVCGVCCVHVYCVVRLYVRVWVSVFIVLQWHEM